MGPFLVGPQGPIPVTVHGLPSANFNFWVGHTNFDVDHPFVRSISLVPGVETLDILTRYRFRLGVGKMYQDREVRAKIDLVASGGASPSVRGQAVAEGKKPYGLLLRHCQGAGWTGEWAVVHRVSQDRFEIVRGKDRTEVESKAQKEEGDVICEHSW